ncbi:MAG: SsrA-binding protein SmpB [Pseudomonadota bacterium]|nr:SsrA-binding protein SmpB [Pseudomonadota bacterium]
MAQKEKETHEGTISLNRRARYDFFIDERYEAGLALFGWEVKSMRAGRVQLGEGYVLIKNDEAWLHGTHLTPLNSASTHVIADPTRSRKLLLKRKEIDHLAGAVDRKGFTLIPLSLYWKNGRAKVEIGLARGKKEHDKRATEKDKDWQREKTRALRERNR